jgi:hypothetical protein
MRNIPGKICRENRNKHFVGKISPEIRAIYKIMLKCRARHVTDDNTTLRSRESVSVTDSKGKNTDTVTIFNTLFAFSTASMVT